MRDVIISLRRFVLLAIPLFFVYSQLVFVFTLLLFLTAFRQTTAQVRNKICRNIFLNRVLFQKHLFFLITVCVQCTLLP